MIIILSLFKNVLFLIYTVLEIKNIQPSTSVDRRGTILWLKKNNYELKLLVNNEADMLHFIKTKSG